MELTRRSTGASVILEGSNSFVARDAGGIDAVPSTPEDELYEDFFPNRVISRFKRWDGHRRQPRAGGLATYPPGRHPCPGPRAGRRTPAGYLAFLRERDVPYLVVGESRVDLDLALRRAG